MKLPPSLKAIIIVIAIIGGSLLFLALLPLISAIALFIIVYYLIKIFDVEPDDDE